jgi:hypothetical protein
VQWLGVRGLWLVLRALLSAFSAVKQGWAKAVREGLSRMILREWRVIICKSRGEICGGDAI